jgi:hypothetical protein
MQNLPRTVFTNLTVNGRESQDQQKSPLSFPSGLIAASPKFMSEALFGYLARGAAGQVPCVHFVFGEAASASRVLAEPDTLREPSRLLPSSESFAGDFEPCANLFDR